VYQLAYQKQNFKNGSILYASQLEAMENGIIAATTPWNLLDNSDFTNPVNQRGATTKKGPIWTHVIDRWYISLDEGDESQLITSEGLAVNADFSIQQRFPKGYLNPDEEYTSAVYFSDGSFRVAEKPSFENAEFDYLSFSIRNIGSKKISAVGLYKGEYTAETLPEYQPKGYGAELAECMRYYQQSFTGSSPKTTENLISGFGTNANWVQSVSFEFPMRCTPTVTLYDYVTGTANAICIWADDSLVSNVTAGCIGNKGFSPLKTNGITTNVSYGFHYTASADL
jgi:hypothetical protein